MLAASQKRRLRRRDSRGRLSPHKHLLCPEFVVPDLLSQDQWQAVFVVADYYYFGVGAFGQVLSRFDSFPFEQRRRYALGYDLLEVADAGGFDAFALGFLGFFLQAKT